MSDEVKTTEVVKTEPVTETAAPAQTQTTTTTVEKKKSSAMPKVLIILVVLLCLCVVCASAAWFIFANVLNKTADALNNAVVNGSLNAINYNSSSNTSTNSSESSDNSTGTSGNYSAGTTIPSTFPTDVPIYTATSGYVTSSTTNTDGKEVVTVMYTAEGDVDGISSFYKTKMASAGYDLQQEVNFLGNTLSFDNAQRNVVVSVLGSSEDSKVLITLVSTNK